MLQQTFDVREENTQARPVVTVRHFRQIVLWPLQIVAGEDGIARRGHHITLEAMAASSQWTLLADEFAASTVSFEERHYREFVSFLPHVQRFLYGDVTIPGAAENPGDIPVRIYRRDDVKRVRIVIEKDGPPLECSVAHTDLYFFYDVDAVILALEIYADEMPLASAQALMQRFGRAYPAGWTADCEPVHCPHSVEWLGEDGAVLARSDFGDRERYLQFVGEKRSACIARHWQFLLTPLVNDADDEAGRLRYREIEYYRMPVMTYLAIDDMTELTTADCIALTLATTALNNNGSLPFSPKFLDAFENDYVYERLYSGGLDAPELDTRFFTSGEALTIVSAGRSESLSDNERGLLGQFRHQYFLLFLIAHFHKATLIMISDRLVATLKKLNPLAPATARVFREETVRLQESFLRFSQRYLFNEISGRAHMRDLFSMIRRHLNVEALHQEVRGEIFDMVQYLDSNALRKQSTSMHRLTVVTIIGLIGTIVTGFLGMNLIAAADATLSNKLAYFAVVTCGVAGLTALTVIYSPQLTRFLERMSGETRTD